MPRTDPFLDSLYRPDLDFAVIERVGEIAAERGVPAAQVALAWLLHKPGVTAPIVGATKIEHVEDALAAEALSLSEDEIERLEAVYVPIPCRESSSRAHRLEAARRRTCPDPPRAARPRRDTRAPDKDLPRGGRSRAGVPARAAALPTPVPCPTYCCRSGCTEKKTE